jgi:hypothetical protein
MALSVEKGLFSLLSMSETMWIQNSLGMIDRMFPWVLWLEFSALFGEENCVLWESYYQDCEIVLV